MKPDVIIATDIADRSEAGQRLLVLAKWLKSRGLQPAVLCLGEGTRDDIDLFSQTAPVVIVDRFRRTGIAAVATSVGMERLGDGIKGRRLRSWLRRRRSATLLIHHPLAACIIRFDPVEDRGFIASLPDPTWTTARMRPEDVDTLHLANGWLTATPEQSREIAEKFGREAVEMPGSETLVDPSALPSVSAASTDGAVVMLTSPDAWDCVDHSVEVAWQLHRVDPDVAIRWVVDGSNDKWLRRHDLRHSGLDDHVTIVDSKSAAVLEGVSVVVRAGYSHAYDELLLAASFAGVPTVTFDEDHGLAAVSTRRFDVETMTATIRELVSDTASWNAASKRQQELSAHLQVENHVNRLVDLIEGQDAQARTG